MYLAAWQSFGSLSPRTISGGISIWASVVRRSVLPFPYQDCSSGHLACRMAPPMRAQRAGGFRLPCNDPCALTIDDMLPVATSFPGFAALMTGLGAQAA